MKKVNSANLVVLVTVISFVARFMSLISVQMYQATFGVTDVYLNIYTMAINVPNIVFTCVGTTLTTIVIPTYTALLTKNDKKRAKSFLDNILSISSLFTVILIILCFVLVPLFVSFTGFSNDPDQFKFAVFSLRAMLPVMFFYVLNYVFQGILQSNGKFFLTTAVTIPSSLCVILYVIFFGNTFGVTGLLFVTLIGLALQALVQLPSVIRIGYRFSPSFKFKDPEIVSCLKQAGPILIAIFAYQFNSLFNMMLASQIGSYTLLYNVYNLVTIAILTLVYSITAVYYPKFSRLWTENKKEYIKSLTDVLKALLFFLIPATVGFIVMRYNVFDLLSRWGLFTVNDAIESGNILALYAIGIIAMGFKEVLDRAFYAQKNTKVSSIAGFTIMGANIVISLSLFNVIGIYALPLSYSISTIIGVTLLLIVLRKKITSFDNGIFKTALKSTIAALIMGVFVVIIRNIIFAGLDENIFDRALKLFVPAFIGVLIYFGVSLILRIEQMDYVKEKVYGIISRLVNKKIS